jgi:hypothetical protein
MRVLFRFARSEGSRGTLASDGHILLAPGLRLEAQRPPEDIQGLFDLIEVLAPGVRLLLQGVVVQAGCRVGGEAGANVLMSSNV